MVPLVTVEVLEMMAMQLGTAIGRIQAEERIRRKNAILEGINRIFREVMTCETEEELGRACLAVAEEMTRSKFGFIGDANPQGLLDDIAMSNPGWEPARMADKSGHRKVLKEFKIHGIHGRMLLDGTPFFTNDLSSHPDSAGLPDVHAPLESFLGAPLIHDGKTIGMVGLGNRQGGYQPEDLDSMEALSHTIVQALMRKRAEQALQESEERFRALAEKLRDVDLRQSEERFYKIFHSSPDIMNIIRMGDGKYIEINQMFIDVFGYTREEVLGHTPEELNIVTDARDFVAPFYEQLNEQGGIKNFELNFRTKSGNIITALCSTEFINLNNETCRLMVMKDITKEKKMEVEMARLDRLHLVGEMAAGIGHEIRNPMTTVRGFLQMLGEKKDCSKYKDYYDLMIEELDRADSIITEFLTLAKNKKADLKVQNLNFIVRAIYPLMQAEAFRGDNYIKLNLADVPNLLLDEKEIRQLVLNLVRNGLEAMSPGGNLTIRTFTDGEEVVLVLNDQGKGIEPDALEKLGTPFFTTKDNGTGLGLSVCYSIAARHNAKIEVETGSNGTTFFVRFRQ
jgi:PAS domain S-box-containing protein